MVKTDLVITIPLPAPTTESLCRWKKVSEDNSHNLPSVVYSFSDCVTNRAESLDVQNQIFSVMAVNEKKSAVYGRRADYEYISVIIYQQSQKKI